jgi:hypothetical protein
VEDALSRHPDPPEQVMALSTSIPVWLEKVQQGYSKDDKTQKIISALLVALGSVPHYTWTDGLLCYKKRIWIGNNKELQQQILHALHTSTLGGHSGIPVTYRKLKELFAWQGMKVATHALVQTCLICQQAKPSRAKYPGLLAPLHVTEGP